MGDPTDLLAASTYETRHRARRARWQLGRVLWPAALVWRRLLPETEVIAITGSFGKTTTKELIAAALAKRHRVVKSRGNANAKADLAFAMLAVRPWHRYAVIEAASAAPGWLRPASRLLRPDIAAILSIGRAHTDRFASLEAVAGEKASLLAHSAPGRVAVLNGDDARVAALGDHWRGRVVTFGSDPRCDVRADRISSSWPARLTLRVQRGTDRVEVRTSLVGTHWAGAVLAALAVACECGVPLASAAEAMEAVTPFPGRMQPVPLPSGALLLRDDYNGSVDSFRASLAVLRDARAGRRVLVLSDYSDSGGSYRQRSRSLSELLAGAVEIVVLVGEHAGYSRRRLMEAGFPATAIYVASELPAAAELLRTLLVAEDLALLRGRTTDHLARLALAQFGPIGCWRSSCSLLDLCDHCPALGTPGETTRAARAGADQG